MRLHSCPRCQKGELFSSGAFWQCAHCEYAITSAALSRDQMVRTDVGASVTAETYVRESSTLKTLLHVLIILTGMAVGWISPVLAEEPAHPQQHEGTKQEPAVDGSESCGSLTVGVIPGVEGVQLETSDSKLFEAFFVSVLHAETVLHKDHPQKDILRGYCYRGLLIVVRQDLQQPRPTGWIQINFTEQDVGRLQQELQRSYDDSPVSKLEESERNRIIRLKLKPDVKRGNRKATRLEVLGPEGFMLGFDQFK